MEAELQDIRRAVQAVNDQADGSAVHRHVRQVRGHKEPAADEGRVLAEAVPGEGELTACPRILGDHIGIAEGDDNHHQRAEGHGYRRAGDTGIAQELLSGVYEAPPSDYASEGNRPDVHGAEAPL